MHILEIVTRHSSIIRCVFADAEQARGVLAAMEQKIGHPEFGRNSVEDNRHKIIHDMGETLVRCDHVVAVHIMDNDAWNAQLAGPAAQRHFEQQAAALASAMKMAGFAPAQEIEAEGRDPSSGLDAKRESPVANGDAPQGSNPP